VLYEERRAWEQEGQKKAVKRQQEVAAKMIGFFHLKHQLSFALKRCQQGPAYVRGVTNNKALISSVGKEDFV